MSLPRSQVAEKSRLGVLLEHLPPLTTRATSAASPTRDAWPAIRTDPQLENRFKPFVRPAWQPGPEAARLLQGFAVLLPLCRPFDLRGAGLVGSVVARTGEVAALRAVATVGGEERITPGVLARAAYRGPAEGHQAVERELA